MQAVETKFGNLSTYRYPSGTYDQDKLGLASLMMQYNGGSEANNFCGPLPVQIGRPMEASTTIAVAMPRVIPWSATKTYIFFAENSTAAATRRFVMYEFDSPTASLTWKGFVTASFPYAGTQGVYTVRALRVVYDKYTTGTVSGSSGSTALTGDGTAWSSGLVPGSRIGFGSTDPAAITSWYEISAIGSDTSITLTSNLLTTIAAGTSYVIEDLRLAVVVTNGTTATNSGLFLIKGLRFENFNSVGTAVAAATTVDNAARTCYWLGDAATSTNTAGTGIGMEDKVNWTTQYIWVGNSTSNPVLYKYNIRAALTLSAGKSTSAFVYASGAGGAVTGAISQNNNGCLVATNHGPGAGINCYYFTTATRIYRTVEISQITSGSTTWLSSGSVMTEVPPGGTTTFAATGAISTIDYASTIDRFVIASTAASGARHYITQFRSDAGQMDRIFGIDTKQIAQTTCDSTAPIHLSTLSQVPNINMEGGITCYCMQGTTAAANLIYVLPGGADWEWAGTTNQRIITPRLLTPNCDKFVRMYVTAADLVGSNVLGVAPEPYRIYYRTAGISDNSGSWTLVDNANDLSSVAGAAAIQFMIEFRVLGTACIPAKIQNIGVVYNDLTTDVHFQPSVNFSDITNKRFAWRFAAAFGSTVPTLRVRLYDAVNGGLLVDDNTSAAATAAFEKSTNDGGTWSNWDNTDKANNTTYIRYTPSSLGDGVKVRALLTLNS